MDTFLIWVDKWTRIIILAISSIKGISLFHIIEQLTWCIGKCEKSFLQLFYFLFLRLYYRYIFDLLYDPIDVHCTLISYTCGCLYKLYLYKSIYCNIINLQSRKILWSSVYFVRLPLYFQCKDQLSLANVKLYRRPVMLINVLVA